jgi:hypothetical protein
MIIMASNLLGFLDQLTRYPEMLKTMNGNDEQAKHKLMDQYGLTDEHKKALTADDYAPLDQAVANELHSHIGC